MFLGICNAVIILTISRPTIVSGEYRSGLFSFDDYESKVGDQNAVDSEECTARLLECLEKDTCDSQICKKEINSNQRIKSQLENWKKRPDVEGKVHSFNTLANNSHKYNHTSIQSDNVTSMPQSKHCQNKTFPYLLSTPEKKICFLHNMEKL